MIIIGAGGLAKQILDVVERLNLNERIVFCDNITKYPNNPKLFNFPIFQKFDEVVIDCNKNDDYLIIGVAKPDARKYVYDFFKNKNLKFQTLISNSALIGKNQIEISNATVILEQVVIESSVKIGKAVLINTGVKIFHDSVVGDFCEIAPNALILGNCIIGNEVFIGANSTILPGITIEDKAVIGAGCVVTKNVSKGKLIKGVPGR